MGLTSVPALASPAQGEVEQEAVVEGGVDAEDIVEHLAFVAVDSVAPVALGQPVVGGLVAIVEKFGAVEVLSNCSVVHLSDIGVAVD